MTCEIMAFELGLKGQRGVKGGLLNILSVTFSFFLIRPSFDILLWGRGGTYPQVPRSYAAVRRHLSRKHHNLWSDDNWCVVKQHCNSHSCVRSSCCQIIFCIVIAWCDCKCNKMETLARSCVVVATVIFIGAFLQQLPGVAGGGCGCSPLWTAYNGYCYR